MCLQCAAGAATALGAAAGIRAWVATALARWVSAPVLRIITIALLIAAVLAAGTVPSA